MAEMLSNPSIIVKANYQNGQKVYLDDFREAYWWLRDNTPEDARVMSWYSIIPRLRYLNCYVG